MMKRCAVLSLAIFGGLMFGGPGWSQQTQQPVPQLAPPGAVYPQPNYLQSGTTNTALGGSLSQSAQSEIAQLVKQLGDADSSAKKGEVTKQLEAAVAKAFDQDLEDRESDLSNLEERVKKLRAQLDRRRRAKDDIIQLQIKVLVNEAEGLGFTSKPRPPAARSGGTSPAYAPQNVPTLPKPVEPKR